jgi:energy-coupling factor transporter ATP-binding protein EcfA2
MTLPESSAPHELDVDFAPHAELPHRMNLLIGRNGTGKTQLLAHLAQTLYGAGTIDTESSPLHGTSEIIGEPPDFSKVIAISYSAFDQFPIPSGLSRQRRKSLFDIQILWTSQRHWRNRYKGTSNNDDFVVRYPAAVA